MVLKVRGKVGPLRSRRLLVPVRNNPNYVPNLRSRTVGLSQRQKKQVKRIINAEHEPKYILSASSYQYIDSNGWTLDLSPIAQGDTDVSRDGDQVRPRSLVFNYQIFLNNSTVTACQARVIIFRWIPFDTTAPTVADLLNSTGSNYSVMSTFVHDKRDNFEVLYDNYHMATTWLNGSSTQPYYKDINIPLTANKPIKFVAGSTVGENKIYALVICDVSSAQTTNRPQLSYYTQLNYIDN